MEVKTGRVAEIQNDAGPGGVGKICAQLFAVSGAEILVAGDETQHSAGAQQLKGPLEEIDIQIRRAGEALVLAFERIFERLRFAITAGHGLVLQFLLPDVRRVANDDIKHAIFFRLGSRNPNIQPGSKNEAAVLVS